MICILEDNLHVVSPEVAVYSYILTSLHTTSLNYKVTLLHNLHTVLMSWSCIGTRTCNSEDILSSCLC